MCRSSRYEISPREREDDLCRLEREFGTQELADADEQDKQFRRGGDGETE